MTLFIWTSTRQHQHFCNLKFRHRKFTRKRRQHLSHCSIRLTIGKSNEESWRRQLKRSLEVTNRNCWKQNHKMRNYICWRLSALGGSMVLLLQLIDCSRYNVIDGNQLENVDRTSLKTLLDSDRVGSELAMARLRTSESNHQSSGVVAIMKRSAPTIARANASQKNDKSAKEPIDGKRTEGLPRIDGPKVASLIPVEAARGDEYSDSDLASNLENNLPSENKINLLARLKSLIASLSDKIILSVNNLKAEQGAGQNTNNDHTALIERRKKRLSNEIVQIIQEDIYLAGASNKSEKADNKVEQGTKSSSNNNNNSIKSTPTLKSMLSGEMIRAGEKTSGTPIKSTSAIWRHNLESLLKDQDLRIENSTFDLGHIKRLHQRELADTNSLTPIAQLKEKVMSFMHFG